MSQNDYNKKLEVELQNKEEKILSRIFHILKDVEIDDKKENKDKKSSRATSKKTYK